MGVKLLSPSLPGEADHFPVTQLWHHLALGYRSNRKLMRSGKGAW